LVFLPVSDFIVSSRAESIIEFGVSLAIVLALSTARGRMSGVCCRHDLLTVPCSPRARIEPMAALRQE